MSDDLDPEARLSELREQAKAARLVGDDRRLLESLNQYAHLQLLARNHFEAAPRRLDGVAPQESYADFP